MSYTEFLQMKQVYAPAAGFVVAPDALHWTNPGDLVFSPFAGVGSEGYVALEEGRRFVGIELKRAYWQHAQRYLADAAFAKAQPTMFDLFDQAA